MPNITITSSGTYSTYALDAPLTNSTNIDFLNNGGTTFGVLVLAANPADLSFNVITTANGANLYTSANIGGTIINFEPGYQFTPGDQITITHIASLFADLDVTSTASSDDTDFTSKVTDGAGLQQYYLLPDGALEYLPQDGAFTFTATEINIIDEIAHAVFGTNQAADNATLDVQFIEQENPNSNVKFATAILTTTNVAINPCFAAGTNILTSTGEIPVENLAVGDLVITHAGEEHPIIWIGRRTIDITTHPRPDTVRSIIIEPGALADNVPARRTRLSPDHAIYLDGVLVPAKELLNWTTIRQDTAATTITYLHIETARHNIIFAENLAVETYLDTGHRGVFDNTKITLHPTTMQNQRTTNSCAPLCLHGPTLATIRQRIASRQVGIRLG